MENIGNDQFKVDNELKQEYLSTKPTNTAKSDSFVLKSADEYEEMINKPMYDMDYIELRDLISMQFRNFSKGVVRKNVSILKRYIDYCIEKNIVIHGENRLSTFRSKDALNFVDQQALSNKHINKKTLRKYQEILYNDQDKLLLELAFLGIGGKKMEEIINLNIKDVDEINKKIMLKNDDGKNRIVEVNLSTIELIKDVFNQEAYVENNGEETLNERLSEPRKTIINKVENFVYRVPGKNRYDKFTRSLLGSRMDRIKKWVDNRFITFTSLKESGIIQMVADIREEKGKLTKEDYINVCNHYHYGSGDSERYWSVVKELFETYLDILSEQ